MNTINHYTDFANAEKYAKDYDAVVSLESQSWHVFVDGYRKPQAL